MKGAVVVLSLVMAQLVYTSMYLSLRQNKNLSLQAGLRKKGIYVDVFGI